MPLRDLLRRGAAQGHCWFTLDVTTGGQVTFRTRPVRNIDTVPHWAQWVAARVTTDRLGPYPAQVARGYRQDGAVVVRFDTVTTWRLIAATQTLDPADGQAVTHGVGGEVFLVHRGGDGGQRWQRVMPEAGGWYRIHHPALPWTVSHPDDPKDADPDPVFESCGPHGESSRCTVCGAVDEIDQQEMPSMVGYGYDTSTRCTLCGSHQSTDPMFGLHTHRAAWPPPQGGGRR